MLMLTNCRVTGEDIELEGAVVVASGESPTATVQISAPDPNKRKFTRVDRLLEASIASNGYRHIIEGHSEYLEQTVGVDKRDSKVTYTVIAKGCKTCR